MTSLAISFRSLKHPLTLASIGLLLLNDHVLKTATPSALTGKLSDFTPQAHVVRLVVFEQSVYASLDYQHSGGGLSEIARSDNGGRRWTVPDPADVPAKVARQLEQPAPLPVTVCDPEKPQTCYRITGAEQVEGSLDGGQTWQVVWQVPWGRRKYMERFIARQPDPQVCKHGLDLGPAGST
jgi:hypothetical protein